MSDLPEKPSFEELSTADKSLVIPPELPVLPLRDTILFPNSFMPLAVARESSVRLIDEALGTGKLIAVFTQRDAAMEEPAQEDLYPVGTATHIHKMFKLPDGSLRLIVQGLARLHLDDVVSTEPYLRARVRRAEERMRDEDRLEIDALQRTIKSNFQQVVSLSPLLSDDLQTLALSIADPGRLADFIASSLSTIGTALKQEMLETLDVRERMANLNRMLIKELEVLELGSKIQSQVQSEVGKNQRDYFLREQMKAIQRELGEGDDQAKEIEELREKIEAAGMPEPVKKEAVRELDRLAKMPVAAAEYTVSRTYIDWLVALPWAKRTDDEIDLARTKSILDAEHDIARLLAERDTPLTPKEQKANLALLQSRIATLWQTRMLRYSKLTVADEIDNALSYYRITFLRELPALYDDIEDELGAHFGTRPAALAGTSYVQMGSWIGGDRDGNPNVNADTR
ncbi:MAG: phosphoenolpyruvate carboxylase, partial [Acidobacteria bacterium]|nr:phosphoenolpyruvate carboxylase [Acidobacteriota bacterium]